MKSFIGAFRAISRCIQRYSSLLSPLEDSVKGIKGNQAITWTSDLETAFLEAQKALKSPRALTIPHPTDKLIMTVDASPLNKGLGATLFILRDNKRLLSGFFSFKLKGHQIGWEPCEHKALAITAGVQHFSPYVRESQHPLQVLTDSKPCVQAYQRLLTGKFSASARVSTFLSCISAHNIVISHISGTNNASSDYSSRHPVSCTDATCAICKFVQETADSVVSTVSVTEVLSGNAQLPFLNRNAWKTAQQNCHDMRRAFAHLTQGTKPSRKARNLKHLRKYLNVATVDANGLIIVRKSTPLFHQQALIVVPYDILPGIITAMHQYLKHPTAHQLTQVFNRYFYGISSRSFIDDVVSNCSHCNSMKDIPKEIFTQRTSGTPSKPGEDFFADVLVRNKQHILVTRDVLSSYTTALIVDDEKADALRSGLIISTSLLRINPCSVRVDTSPGFQALRDDELLKSIGMKLDYGRVKNKDSNSVADKAIQELEKEFLKHGTSEKLTSLQLQLAVDTLNSRIRNRDLSSKEIVLKRDQYSNIDIQVNDNNLSQQQQTKRSQNHIPSSRSKAGTKAAICKADVIVGDLVYVKHEKDKHKIRDRFIITKREGRNATVQKMNEKFMSKQYLVPLERLYLAQPRNSQSAHVDSSSSSDDDDFGLYMNNGEEIPHSNTEEESMDEDTPSDESENEGLEHVSGRPQRNRRLPKHLRSGEYELY